MNEGGHVTCAEVPAANNSTEATTLTNTESMHRESPIMTNEKRKKQSKN